VNHECSIDVQAGLLSGELFAPFTPSVQGRGVGLEWKLKRSTVNEYKNIQQCSNHSIILVSSLWADDRPGGRGRDLLTQLTLPSRTLASFRSELPPASIKSLGFHSTTGIFLSPMKVRKLATLLLFASPSLATPRDQNARLQLSIVAPARRCQGRDNNAHTR